MSGQSRRWVAQGAGKNDHPRWWGLPLILIVPLLVGCERQADRVFDRNPEYAGKRDVHERHPGAEILRRRVLMVQTDR